jgi:acyl-CoA thioesterase-1
MKRRQWIVQHCSALALAWMAPGLAAAQAPQGKSRRIVVLGDSLSAEYGIARGSGWVALLERKLQEEKIAATVVN